MPSDRRLLKQESRATVFLVLATLAGTVGAAAVIALAYFLSVVVSRVFLRQQTLSDVLPVLYLMLALLLVRGSAIWGREIFAQHSASVLKSDLRGRLSSHLFLLGPLYTRAERSGELVNTIVEGVESLDPYIGLYLPTKFLAVVVPTLVFIAVLVLSLIHI